MSGKQIVCKCHDQQDLEESRNIAKKGAKKLGSFSRCKGNTVYLKNGDSIRFEIGEDVPADVDETLPPEAFRKAARDMLE